MNEASSETRISAFVSLFVADAAFFVITALATFAATVAESSNETCPSLMRA